MCTVIVATRVWPTQPLVVAANRDERLDRPAEPPRRWDLDGTRAIAPRDARAGGTWVGLNEHGVFVALTNRFGPADPARPSRGRLVTAALTHRSAASAFDAAAGRLRPDEENGFHLILADRAGAFVVVNDLEILRAAPLAPGTHVVTERSFGAAATRRDPWLEARVRTWDSATAVGDSTLQTILAHRDPHDGFEGVLVSVPAHRYGTRSATIVRLHDDGSHTYLHADGPPDRAPFEDFSSVLTGEKLS